MTLASLASTAAQGAKGNFVVEYGSGSIALLDPIHRSVISRLSLPAHPEGFQLAPSGRKLFVNVPDAERIVALDTVTGAATSWRPHGLAQNFPIALDASGRTVAIVQRSPARLVLLDATSGTVGSLLPTCGDSDVLFFDARRTRIYVSCGAGPVNVFERKGESWVMIARIATRPGPRTSLFVPEMDRLFVAARAAPQAGFHCGVIGLSTWTVKAKSNHELPPLTRPNSILVTSTREDIYPAACESLRQDPEACIGSRS